MLSYLEILRPQNGVIGIFAVIVGAMLVGFNNYFFIALACLSVFIILSAGNVINDYFDYEIDKINKKNRPIPSGRIKRNSALYYSIALFLIGIALAFYLNFNNFILALINSGLLILYSYKLKGQPLIGNVIVSWLVGSTFIFGSLLGSGLSVTVLLIFTMAFFANLGRELAKSIEDMEADRKLKLKTLPIVAGKSFTTLLLIISLLFAVLISFVPYMLNFFGLPYLLVVVIADIIFLVSGFMVFMAPKKSQNLMKIGMIISIIAFLVGVIV